MVEAGHFALVLAFALALIQSTVPLIGARMPRRAHDGGRRAGRRHRLCADRGRLRGADDGLCPVGLFGRQRLGEFPFG